MRLLQVHASLNLWKAESVAASDRVSEYVDSNGRYPRKKVRSQIQVGERVDERKILGACILPLLREQIRHCKSGCRRDKNKSAGVVKFGSCPRNKDDTCDGTWHVEGAGLSMEVGAQQKQEQERAVVFEKLRFKIGLRSG